MITHFTRHRPLLAVLLGFAVLSLLYNRSVPPFEGPDEPEHFAYALWLADGRGFPPQGEAAWQTPVRQEAGQPPLYYLLASLPVHLVDYNQPPAVFRPNPHFPSSAPGHIPDNKNIAIHYPADNLWQGGWLALQLARGVSFLFGLLLIICVYLLAGTLFPHSGRTPALSAAMTAVIPQVLFIGNVVSNDMAAAATGALTLWLLARLVQGGPSVAAGLALGAAFGLASLSKTSGLALGLPLAAVFAWLWWQAAGGQRRRVVRAALAAAGAALLIGGWWYLRSWLLYGSPFGLDAHYFAPWALTAGSPRPDPLAEWQEVYYSLWAAFGWGNIKFPGWVYYPLVGLLLLALVGLFLKIKQSSRLPFWLLLLVPAVGAVVLALAVWMQQVTAPHGRLLFPALAAIVLLLVIGWERLHRGLVYGAAAYLFILACLSLVLLIRPAYAEPEFLGVDEIEEDAALNWHFGNFVRLLTVTAVDESAAAGESLPVSVCWQALGRTEEDYTVLVQLVGPENQVAAGRRTYPGLGSYPTSTWEAGRTFCDDIRVDIPADLARTLRYQIEVGFISQTGERLAAAGDDGRPREHLFAAAVRLEASQESQLAQTPPGNDPIRLSQAEFDQTWQAGTTEQVTLTWWTAEPVHQDYTVFVHLRDGQDGQNAAQGDGPPLNGWYPTSLWEAGEVVKDSHEVVVAADVAPGAYQLVVGWYHPLTGERLGSEVPLGTVEVVR